jgi:hypothetical protein
VSLGVAQRAEHQKVGRVEYLAHRGSITADALGGTTLAQIEQQRTIGGPYHESA